MPSATCFNRELVKNVDINKERKLPIWLLILILILLLTFRILLVWIDVIRFLDTIMLPSWAPHSLLPYEDGAGSLGGSASLREGNLFVSLPIIFRFWIMDSDAIRSQTLHGDSYFSMSSSFLPHEFFSAYTLSNKKINKGIKNPGNFQKRKIWTRSSIFNCSWDPMTSLIIDDNIHQ